MEVEPTTNNINGEEWRTIQEGQAKILVKGNEAFYNPVQEVNRDLSILMIRMFQEQFKLEKEADKKNNQFDGIRILEALSATGLRSIRYFKEIPNIKQILVNDIEPAAVETIRRNLEHNGIDTTKVKPNQGDACVVMIQNKNEPFDVVDIDPYGTAAIFLDGAVQAVSEGGMLCVTCTDMAVLCGNHPEAAYAKYHAIPLHARFMHEMGVRTLLGSINSRANVYKRYIVPVLSLSIDFYCRVFVRVYTSAAEVKKSIVKNGYVYNCTGCDSFWTQTIGKHNNNKFTISNIDQSVPSTFCPECTRPIKIGGPVWLDPIHDREWLKKAMELLDKESDKFNQCKKIYGLLKVAHDELPHKPLYYELSSLSAKIHVSTPSLNQMRSALVSQGYTVTSSHANPSGLKTDASNKAVWDIMRSWAKLNPPKNISQTSPGFYLLSKEPEKIADFTIREDAKVNLSVPRFLPNPTADWGPGTRAGKKVDPELRKKNQNKSRRKRQKKSGDGDFNQDNDDKQKEEEEDDGINEDQPIQVNKP